MDKMKITAYTDGNYKKETGSLMVQINPKSYQLQKGIQYDKNKEQGNTKSSETFSGYKTEELSFEIVIDCTGVVPGTGEEDMAYDKVKVLEDLLYRYRGKIHRPAFVILAWGTILFKGQLRSLKTDYTLFKPDGMPLRAKVSLSFGGFMSKEEATKEAVQSSPDMSHLMVVRAGDSIAAMCEEIYGDSTLVDEVARVNGLCGFRQVKPGTELLFPHLKKR